MGNKVTISAKDKTYLVTGSNTGIGYETALVLARNGGRVLCAARNMEKAESTVKRIISETDASADDLIPVVVSLSSLKDVQDAAEEIKRRFDKIHVLILNAGIMALPSREETEDGIEKQIAVNHFAHFALFRLLESIVTERVISLSSLAHTWCPAEGIREDWNFKGPDSYSPFEAYGQSKLANILFIREVEKRYPELFTAVVHPGYVRTELGRNMQWGLRALTVLMYPLTWFISKSCASGALTTLHTALEPLDKLPSGKYWADSCVKQESELAQSDDLSLQLWNLSENIIAEKLNITLS